MLDFQRWKLVRTEAVAADRIVCPGGGWLLSIDVSAGAGGAASVHAYDGPDATAGVLIAECHTIATDCRVQDYRHPRRFERELFVDLSANVDHCIVQYMRDPLPK